MFPTCLKGWWSVLAMLLALPFCLPCFLVWLCALFCCYWNDLLVVVIFILMLLALMRARAGAGVGVVVHVACSYIDIWHLTSTILFSSGTNEQQLPQHHTAEGTSPTSAEASICTLPPPPPQPVHAKPVDEFPSDHEWSDWLKTFHKPHYPIPLEAFWIVPKFDKSDDSPNLRPIKDRVRDRKADILKAHQLCMSAFDNIRGLFLQPSPTGNNWVDCSDFDLYDKGVQYKGTRKPIFSKRFEKQQGYFCMFHALDCLFDCATFNARLADAALPALLNAFAFPPEMLDREICRPGLTGYWNTASV